MVIILIIHFLFFTELFLKQVTKLNVKYLHFQAILTKNKYFISLYYQFNFRIFV